MKTKFKSYLSILVASLLLGCSEDFLERAPLDEVTTSNFYQTEEDAFQALVSIYDALGYQSSPNISWVPFVTTSDILSDDAFAGGADANDGLEYDQLNTFNIPPSSTKARSIWAKNYAGIYRANIFLEQIEGMDTSDEFRVRTTAEAKFMRAHFYFELVRFFENIPLLINTLAGPSEYNQPQADPQEVYNQIASDLLDAAADLPETIAVDERGRISSWAASSLLGRVFLFYNGVYGGDLQAGDVTVNSGLVLEHLEDVINNSGHDLLENYEDIFRLASQFSVESVFEITHGDAPAWWDWLYVRGGNGNLASQMQGPRVESGSTNWNRGWSFATVSEGLVQAMAGDPRLDATILYESELDGVLAFGYQHTGYYSQKYSSDAEHWGAGGQFELNRTTNQRVIRFSDVLLMAAELGSPSAQTYLDRVRARVGLSSVPVTLDNIYHERRMEFALEGLRYFDVIRRGMDYASQELTHSGERGANYQGDQQIFDVTFDASTRGFLPIPQTEMDLANGAWIQNDGY